MLRTSERGIAFIKKHEGFVKYAVWDYAQYSIGYGSHCRANEYPNGITQAEADRLLRLELESETEPVIAGVERTRGRRFLQCEWDALASFTYNLGAQWVNDAYTVCKFVVGQYEMDEAKFIAAFEAWSYAGGQQLAGLVRRRREEARAYLYGDYADGMPCDKEAQNGGEMPEAQNAEAEIRYCRVGDVKNEELKQVVVKAIRLGFLNGRQDEDGRRETTDDTVIDLGEDAVRLLAVCDRAGVFGG